MADERWPVLVTRRLPAPAMERIAERCDITLHDGPGAIPRDRLLEDIRGKLGAVTLLTDRAQLPAPASKKETSRPRRGDLVEGGWLPPP